MTTKKPKTGEYKTTEVAPAPTIDLAINGTSAKIDKDGVMVKFSPRVVGWIKRRLLAILIASGVGYLTVPKLFGLSPDDAIQGQVDALQKSMKQMQHDLTLIKKALKIEEYE